MSANDQNQSIIYTTEDTESTEIIVHNVLPKNIKIFTMEDKKILDTNELTGKVIGCAIEVHRTLGPGLLESAYEQCLAHELDLRQIPFRL